MNASNVSSQVLVARELGATRVVRALEGLYLEVNARVPLQLARRLERLGAAVEEALEERVVQVLELVVLALEPRRLELFVAQRAEPIAFVRWFCVLLAYVRVQVHFAHVLFFAPFECTSRTRFLKTFLD